MSGNDYTEWVDQFKPNHNLPLSVQRLFLLQIWIACPSGRVLSCHGLVSVASAAVGRDQNRLGMRIDVSSMRRHL